MARPQNLGSDFAAVKAEGIDTVVSLLEPDEAEAIGLRTEKAASIAAGITFISHPIRDMHLPEPTEFAMFAAKLANRLTQGERIAVHCYASIGRSGMLACTVLGHFGYTADRAIAHVSEMRGTAIPDTPEQIAFIKSIMTHPQS